MPTPDAVPPVWLTGFWGFEPEEEGILGFTEPTDRDRLFKLIDERQLVCIYGAASPEIDRRVVHHLLGILEVERVSIDSWDKMSDLAKRRNVALGRQRKWRYAMPVRRAWRTKHTLDVSQVFPKSYDPKNGRYIARFGTWLVPEESRWLLERVPFTQVNVFGEPPITISDDDRSRTTVISTILTPSRGVFGSFGERSFHVEDKPHDLYLARFPSSPELLAGRPIPNGMGLIKIGISGSLKNRLKALNLSFPETATIGWKITRHARFPDRFGAANAEAEFKAAAVQEYGATSLGKEFFIMEINNAESLFNKLSPVTGLHLRVIGGGSK